MTLILLAPLGVAEMLKPNYSDMSLDELVNIKITSVSRGEKSLARAAAAAFVITREDIERSGLTSIPELLRMVPGLDIARLDANKWAVTSRGFNERFADKMQILMDGRSVLTPLTSGVHWDVEDLVLEDIERIEIVKGPGATLWGANAVNGVINIITRTAKDTQGALVTAETSKEGRGTGAARYGGRIGQSSYYRVFIKDTNVGDFSDASGNQAADSLRLLHAGVRTDWDPSPRDKVTFLADMYTGSAGQTVDGLISLKPPLTGLFNDRTSLNGGNLQGRWHRSSSDHFDTTFQMYFTSTDRDQAGEFGYVRRTLDVELVQHFAAGSRSNIIWGGDWRRDADQTRGSLNISFDPANRATSMVGAFVQDEIALVPGRLWLTAGAKLEHNPYSGLALQPNVRLMWALRPRHSLWAAVAHVAEDSSRADADIRGNSDVFVNSSGITTLVSNFGTHVLPADKATTYELGYRGQSGERLTYDVATYYNHYYNRHSHEPGEPYLEGPTASPYLVIPTVVKSLISGETHGMEFSGTAKISRNWKLTAGYALFQIHLRAAPPSQDTSTARETEGNSPHHQFSIRSMLNVSRTVRFDTAMYYVARLPGPEIPEYVRLDARLGWRFSHHYEASFGAQNLLDPRHFEFGSGDLVSATQVGRNIYAKLTWRY